MNTHTTVKIRDGTTNLLSLNRLSFKIELALLLPAAGVDDELGFAADVEADGLTSATCSSLLPLFGDMLDSTNWRKRTTARTKQDSRIESGNERSDYKVVLPIPSPTGIAGPVFRTAA